MLQQILDNIEGILVELKDNDINFEFDVKDKRVNMFRMDIKFIKEDRYGFKISSIKELFDEENDKMTSYISEAFLTLDAYLKKMGMNVKVHCSKNAGKWFGPCTVTMKEFTEFDSKGLRQVVIGIDKDPTTPKLEKRIYSFSQFINEELNESLVVPRQPIDQMADTFIPEVFDKFDIDYCKPEDEEKMGDSRTPFWTFVFEDRDGKGGLLETPYEQFLEICWLDSELYTNVMNELLAVKSMVERRTGYSYELKHNTGWGYGFITILTRDKYGNFLRPE